MSAGLSRDRSSASAAGDTGGQLQRGAMPFLTQQYALPIHHEGSRLHSADSSQNDREDTPRAENKLRRKTPNGTLNAAYDGTVEYPNPQKHQLIAGDGCTSHIASESGKQTFSQHQQRQNDNRSGWATPTDIDWRLPQQQQAYPFPVMDFVLHQMSIGHMGPHAFYGQAVPYVIQPSLQYLGPTASGVQGTGPYGPYWHDGTYVPYRPAALRDPHLYRQPPARWAGSLPSPRLDHEIQLSLQHEAQLSPWTSSFGSHAPGTPMYARDRAAPSSSYFDVSLAAHNRHLYGAAYLPDGNGHEPDAGPSTVAAEFGQTSPNGRQRDRTFAWALQQYRDLVAFVQHHRRPHHPSRHGSQQQAPRPAFYPRPPKPTHSGSRLDPAKRRSASDTQAQTSLSGHPENEADEPYATSFSSQAAVGDTPKLRPTSLWSPSGVYFQDNEYDRRTSCDQWRRPTQPHQQQQWQGSGQYEQDYFRTLRRSSGSTVSSIAVQLPQDDSPRSRAAVALSYLTRLCQEANWRWTDGMLLGGCLTYGLGNYQQAHRWYTKVIEMDPTHLEATSNLAATLLALGRRQEAEQHWTKVVKAAPNHFEAVEHLVGLLCNEHRGSDAVRVIEYVEASLRRTRSADAQKGFERQSEGSSSTASCSPCQSELSDRILYEFDTEGEGFTVDWHDNPASSEPGFGSSGFAISGCDNGRILALIHAKGNMLYGLGDNRGAARAFEDAVLIATGRRFKNIQGIVHHVLAVVCATLPSHASGRGSNAATPILLPPDQALATAKLCFPHSGELPGLQHVPGDHRSQARKAVISTTSNSLLSLAKIYQDGMSNSGRSLSITPLACGVRDILALYYLSLSLQPSPSTANNVGILLASVQQAAAPVTVHEKLNIPGVVPGSGVALALQYYNYGLQLDQHHAHLYTNLGSLLKDIGQLDAAINMYERAVKCDGKFDIALANLANAVKDKGRISDAIVYYKRAVDVSPDFAEAVCGLANALTSVCGWQARGGIAEDGGRRDRWHVDQHGMLLDARQPGATSSGWIKRVVDIVEKQLVDGEKWGRGTLNPAIIEEIVQQV
ncbi:hypothetical protein LTR53_016252, partial [Teratosphaeriaceae sp. CCFEE 6253]